MAHVSYAAMTNITDIDALVPAAPASLTTKQVRLFGRVWDVVVDVNDYALTAVATGDPAAFRDLIVNAVVDDQREEMHQALLRERGMTTERFAAIANAVLEVAAGRPTKSPSGSSRTRATPASGRKSTAVSSKAQGARRAR